MYKVLVIAHNAMDKNTNNGRTLLELFSGFDKNNLAQLVLHPNKINPEYCSTTFQITEIDILKNFFRKKRVGNLIENCDEEVVNHSENTASLYRKGSKKKSSYVLCRNLIWDTKKWFNKKLKNWLKEFNPDVIFFFAGGSTFSLKLTMKISKFLNIPYVSFWTDDYYLNNENLNGFFGLINNHIYKKQVRKLMKKGEYISLTDLMLEKYDKVFSKQGNCIYTTSSMKPFENKIHNLPLTMSFLGNISFDRYKSLIDIADCICENQLPITFNLYTAEKREWILNNVLNVKCLNYCGQVEYDKVKEIICDSDILVHVENFGKDTIKEVKYSLSTKIADSLSSNRCLLAYGPDEVASMDYLIKNNCAIIATSRQELEEKLKQLVNNTEILDEKANFALKIAECNHNPANNQAKINQIFEQMIANSVKCSKEK